MTNNSIFIFQSDVYKDKKSGDYNLYLFKDFTGDEKNIHEEVFDVLDEVRQRIHTPKAIYIICSNQSHLDKEKIKSRFVGEQAIEYIDYQNVTSDIFKYGIAEIVAKNKVTQHAPHGTRFKKTSGAESDYFIKASLSLLEYSEVCFIALATCHKITLDKLLSVKKIYVDTSSIISLVQAIIYCCNILQENNKLNPQIINFKSYEQNNIDFNLNESFTIISASSSGNLRNDNRINDDKCLTLFYPKSEDQKEACLFQLDNIKNTSVCDSPRLIPLTSEDFSLEYSKSTEVIIKKLEIESIDSKQLIKKLLGDEFKNISYGFDFDEIKKRDCIRFEPEYLYKLLEDNKFIDDTFSRSFSLEKGNCIIYDFENPKKSLSNIQEITKEDFIKQDADKGIENKNIVVFLTQATSNELINISQKLRKYRDINITYIIGVLVTDNCQQSKNLENNICFNDTSYKYDFYCYLNLPLSTTINAAVDSYKLSNGFVFYDQVDASDLNPKQVYLVVCLILELLRSNGKLSDNISHHDVLSPKNFSRFNDSLLQLSILSASKGRELNFHSNIELSREMKDVIMDLMKEKEDIGKIFIESVKDDQIKLTDKDLFTIKEAHSELFEQESTI